jgi:drug/metabolite transporter (DMT)-like permease
MTPPGQFHYRNPETSADQASGPSHDPAHKVHDLDPGRTRTGARLFREAYLLLSLTSLFWSGNVVIGRYIAGYIPPITVSVIRWGGAFLILLPFAIRHLPRDWPLIRRHVGLLTLLALTGFAAYNTMAYYGLHFTTAINGLLLQSVSPLFVALWSFVLFRDRLSARQAAGICLSLAGVVVIVCHGSSEILFALAFNQGDLCLLRCGAAAAPGDPSAVFSRRRHGRRYGIAVAGHGAGDRLRATDRNRLCQRFQFGLSLCLPIDTRLSVPQPRH